MKAVVSGGRDYVLTESDYLFLERALRKTRMTEICTDGLPGVSAQVETWAKLRAIPVTRVTANFMHDGPATPEERNTSLVALARVVIAFPGGTADDLIAKAKKARRTVLESPGRQLASLPKMGMRFRHLEAPPHHRPKLTP